MSKSNAQNGPVVTGGVGGSGTRVVAEILSIFGYYMGNDLNDANDNLLYTLIFKRPKWFYDNYRNRQEIDTGIELFEKLMLRNGSLSLPELRFLSRAVVTMSRYGHSPQGLGKGVWPFLRLQKLVFPRERFGPQHIGWGWKEPNSHLLLEDLARHFDNLKYIHTIRHGLDMAFSKNQQQLLNWGPLYGVTKPASYDEQPNASLQYWVKANERVLEVGRRLGEERFLVINFDQLCLSPTTGIDELVSFLGVQVDESRYQKAIQLIRKPSSLGRYKQHDINQFNSGDLNSLQRLGFSVE